ncbi:MAG: GIY-YIG nuclease family protein [Clostridia bacterium]|nr:GIY-YIG nuclease family protein [Clostridia bacterium]
MKKGVIYVLTNPSFPEYVKIGYADNLEYRLRQLNKSECLPFAFRAYCVYEVEGRLRDKDVHNLIDKLNPGLRAIETFDGKPRIREFYNITAEDAYEILYSIASISSTTDKLKKIAPEGHKIIDEYTAEEFQNSGAVQYTEQDHISHGSETTKRLYVLLRDRILLFGNISIEPKTLDIAFKTSTNICDIEIQKSTLKIYINLPSEKLKDPYKFAKDISKIGHWGNGDYVVYLNDEDMLDYVLDLIKQSYDDKENNM